MAAKDASDVSLRWPRPSREQSRKRSILDEQSSSAIHRPKLANNLKAWSLWKLLERNQWKLVNSLWSTMKHHELQSTWNSLPNSRQNSVLKTVRVLLQDSLWDSQMERRQKNNRRLKFDDNVLYLHVAIEHGKLGELGNFQDFSSDALSVTDRRSLQLAVRIGSQITMATDWCVWIHFKFRQLKDLRGSEARIWKKEVRRIWEDRRWSETKNRKSKESDERSPAKVSESKATKSIQWVSKASISSSNELQPAWKFHSSVEMFEQQATGDNLNKDSWEIRQQRHRRRQTENGSNSNFKLHFEVDGLKSRWRR